MDGSKDGWMDGGKDRAMEELINGGIGGLRDDECGIQEHKEGEMRDGMRNEGWNEK